MEGRCRGHCCRCFVLSIPYEDLKKSVAKEIRNVFLDGEQVLDMLVPLGVLHGKEVMERFGVSSRSLEKDEPRERFTCRHLQENGDCGIYETRPHLCRSYPRVACEYKECQASCSVLSAIRNKEREVVFDDVKAE